MTMFKWTRRQHNRRIRHKQIELPLFSKRDKFYDVIEAKWNGRAKVHRSWKNYRKAQYYRQEGCHS